MIISLKPSTEQVHNYYITEFQVKEEDVVVERMVIYEEEEDIPEEELLLEAQ
jgi:hypothetical protein